MYKEIIKIINRMITTMKQNKERDLSFRGGYYKALNELREKLNGIFNSR